MGYLLQFFIVKIFSFLLALFPLPWVDGMARRFGDALFLIMGERRKIAFSNLGKAYGRTLSEAGKREMARACFQNAALSMTELFSIRRMKKIAKARFILLGNEILEKAFSRGKGVVLVIAHLGSWEYLEFLPYFTKRHWSVVVKDIKNPYVNRMIDTLRRVSTVIPISKSGSTRAVFKELRENHGVAILIDQWAGPEGIWMDFFESPTSTTSIPARLAQKTGCALVFACCLRIKPGHYEILLGPEVPFDGENEHWEWRTTQALNRELEKLILKHPKQWLWFHKRWKDKPAFLRSASGQEIAASESKNERIF